MVMTVCGECSKEISTKAAACPNCGAKKPKSYVWLYVVLGLVAAFFVLGAVQGSKPEVQERRQEERAIAECWSSQEAKSHSPSAARFIAGACEKMEGDYVQKHGRRP